MKRLTILAVALALSCTAVLAAEVGEGSKAYNLRPVVIGGITRSDSVAHSLTTDANGNTLVTEASPFYDNTVGPLTLIGPNSAFTNGVADSNAVPVDVHRLSSGTLYMRVTRTSGTEQYARFAIQVRGHLFAGTDSLSVHALPLFRTMNWTQTSVGILADTTAVGQITTGTATAPWPTEFTYTFDVSRTALAGSSFAFPEGDMIPLARFYGTPLNMSYMSVRVRLLRGSPCNVTLVFEGRP